MSDMIDRDAAIAAMKRHSDVGRKFMSSAFDDRDGDTYDKWSGIVSHVDLCEEAIRALPAVEVGVKPLEWTNVPTGYGPETYEAYATTGFYQVFTDEDSCCGAVFAEFATNRGQFGTTSARGVARVNGFTDAKAAAQADYAARIRSALTVTPARKEVMPDDAAEIDGLPQSFDTSPGVTAGAVTPAPDAGKVQALVDAIAPQISEGIGAILRKFCDSIEASKARAALHSMPTKDWETLINMLAEAAASAALAAMKEGE